MRMHTILRFLSARMVILCLIQKVQKLGKKVENAFSSVSRSGYLKQVCNKSIRIDDYIFECLRNKDKPSVAQCCPGMNPRARLGNILYRHCKYMLIKMNHATRINSCLHV